MSAPKVDVLAVLDEFVVVVGDEFGNDPAVRLREARDAVAELIEAAQRVAVHQDASISSEWDALDAALANVGGQP